MKAPTDIRHHRLALVVAAALALGLVGGAPVSVANSGGAGASASADTFRLSIYKRSTPQNITRLKKRGIGMRLGCTRACFVSAKLVTDARTAARLQLTSRVVGRAARQIGDPRFRASLRVRLYPEVAGALGRRDAFSWTLKVYARQLK